MPPPRLIPPHLPSSSMRIMPSGTTTGVACSRPGIWSGSIRCARSACFAQVQALKGTRLVPTGQSAHRFVHVPRPCLLTLLLYKDIALALGAASASCSRPNALRGGLATRRNAAVLERPDEYSTATACTSVVPPNYVTSELITRVGSRFRTKRLR